MMDYDFLKALCLAYGPSGMEEGIRDRIARRIIDSVDSLRVDGAGNLIAFRKGYDSGRTILYNAHMDEVGVMVTGIDRYGCLLFETVGGIDPRVLPSKRVLFENGMPGVVGSRAVHTKSKEERLRAAPVKDLFIDIGASGREDAARSVKIGDCAVFASDFLFFGENGARIKAKALDDRLGCCLLCGMAAGEPPKNDSFFVFTTGEEIGCQGAKSASYDIRPDLSVTVECTTAADIGDVSGADRVCALGMGAVLSFLDGGTIYDRELYFSLTEQARQNGIRVQTKTIRAGGNDARSLQWANAGTRAVALSAPCRYLHSPCCVADRFDIEEMEKIIRLIDRGAEG